LTPRFFRVLWYVEVTMKIRTLVLGLIVFILFEANSVAWEVTRTLNEVLFWNLFGILIPVVLGMFVIAAMLFTLTLEV
jgi:hypothetical protein